MFINILQWCYYIDITVDYTNLIYWGISQSTRAYQGKVHELPVAKCANLADHCRRRLQVFVDVDLADRSSKIMNQL